jgi:hypothetical protein
MLISQRTSYEYRGSSLLTPTQIMEQETYYRYAEVAVQHVTYILQLILLHQAWYITLRTTIGQWSGIASMASAIASAWGKMQRKMNVVNQMFFIARWIRAHGEITLSYAKDLTVFIQRRHRFGLNRFRRINDVPYQDCYTWFGQYPQNLRRLHVHLRVPQSFMLPTGQIYGGEECFLISLYHLTKGTPFTEMARFVFGGDPRGLSEMNILFINHGYITFYNKISSYSMNQWIPHSLHICRQLIYDLCQVMPSKRSSSWMAR